MPRVSDSGSKSGPRIDVLIPAIEKDLRTLPHVVHAVKLHIRHPVGEVIIVAPPKEKIRSLCLKEGWRFVDENTVLPITKKDIRYRSERWERSGWLFQQLLKLSGDKLCKTDYFLVIDADTVLIRPHTFRSGGKTTFYTRNWSQPEYFRTYHKLMGAPAESPHSLVTHYMLFERAKLAELKQTIEARHNMRWYKAILKSMNLKKQFGFSEYETYGNFLYSRYPGAVRMKKALNRALHTSVEHMSQAQYKTLAAKYRSVSFHERKGYSRRTAKAAAVPLLAGKVRSGFYSAARRKGDGGQTL